MTELKKAESPLEHYEAIYKSWYAGDVGLFDHIYKWAIDAYVENYKGKKVIDVGCGPGRLSEMALARGYVINGLDYSTEGLLKAQKRCPNNKFYQCDAFKAGDILKEYECFITTEFLEHIQNDLEFIKSLPDKAIVIASVPNFDYPSHVRYFSSIPEVYERYGKVLTKIHCIAYGSYLFHGVKI